MITALILGLALQEDPRAAEVALGSVQREYVLAQQEMGKLNLKIIKPEIIKVDAPIVGTGTIYAAKTSNIGPLVKGQIRRIHVKVGDQLEKGAPLFEIRPDIYRFRVEEAKAHLAMARAKATEAQLNFDRASKLIKRGNVSKSTLDKARSAFEVSRAEVDLANVNKKMAEQDLADTMVRAPFKSVVTFRYLDEGVYVSTGGPGSSGNSVVELKMIDIVTAIVQVPSHEIERLRLNAPATLKISGIKAPVKAKVTVINDKVDIATRTAEVRVVIQNPDYAIKPGLFVYSEIEPKIKTALVIPRRMVLGTSADPFVFVLKSGKARRRPVRVLDFDALRVEVTSGLTVQESIISGPDLPRVVDDMRISEMSSVAR